MNRVSPYRKRVLVVAILAVGAFTILASIGIRSRTSTAESYDGTADVLDGPALEYLEMQGISRSHGQQILDSQERLMPVLIDLLAATDETQYAGAWFDWDDLALHFATTEPSPSEEQRRIAASGAVTFETVDFSLEELTAARDIAIAAARAKDPMASAWVKFEDNAVVVATSDTSRVPSNVQISEDSIPIRVEQGSGNASLQAQSECVFPNCDAPLRGGTNMWWDPTGFCSAGFNAVGRDNGLRYLLTAGHCLSNNQTWKTFQPRTGSSHTIGQAVNWRTDSFADAGIIAVNNPAPYPSGWGSENIVKIYASNDGATSTADVDRYPVNGLAASVEGQIVCRTGRSTATTCGAITEVIVQPPGLSQTRTVRVSTVGPPPAGGGATCQGDSGGPVIKSGWAFGLVTSLSEDGVYAADIPTGAPFFDTLEDLACTRDGFYYQIAAEAENVMNVDIIHP